MISTTKQSTAFHPDDFDALPRDRAGFLESVTQRLHVNAPVQTFSQLLSQRLLKKPVSVAAILVIALVLLMTLFGPLLWPVDPARQNMAEISLPPVGARQAELVDHQGKWHGGDELHTAASGILSVSDANTERVRLLWSAVPEAFAYQVYRHILEPSGDYDLGIPLAELSRHQTWYEDRMGLKNSRYIYSVVPLIKGADGRTTQRGTRISIAVTPRSAISYWDAQLAGLVDEDAPRIAGQTITLPTHPMGTDYVGRDILARLIYGARTSLFIGLVAPLCFIGFGMFYGAVAGYLGGRVDQWMMRVVDFVIALPFLLFMILFKVMFGLGSDASGAGESGIMPMLVAMILLGWPDSARLVRGQVLQLRENAYIDAARLMGGSNSYIIVRHLLPNVVGVLLVSFSFAIPSAIFTEAFLSFIGLGVVPPTPSWGSMCNDGIRTMLTHPHELLFPALMISVTVLAFNLLGDGLRDALDCRESGA